MTWAAVAGLVRGQLRLQTWRSSVPYATDRQLQHYWRDGAGWHEGRRHRPRPDPLLSGGLAMCQAPGCTQLASTPVL